MTAIVKLSRSSWPPIGGRGTGCCMGKDAEQKRGQVRHADASAAKWALQISRGSTYRPEDRSQEEGISGEFVACQTAARRWLAD